MNPFGKIEPCPSSAIRKSADCRQTVSGFVGGSVGKGTAAAEMPGKSRDLGGRLFLGREFPGRIPGMIDRRRIYAEAPLSAFTDKRSPGMTRAAPRRASNRQPGAVISSRQLLADLRVWPPRD